MLAVIQILHRFFFSRMNAFENDLFATVDSILHLLGQKPQISKETYDRHLTPPTLQMFPGLKGDKSVRPKGARLLRSPSDLDRALQNM